MWYFLHIDVVAIPDSCLQTATEHREARKKGGGEVGVSSHTVIFISISLDFSLSLNSQLKSVLAAAVGRHESGRCHSFFPYLANFFISLFQIFLLCLNSYITIIWSLEQCFTVVI